MTSMKDARDPGTYTTSELRALQKRARDELAAGTLAGTEAAEVTEWLAELDAEDTIRKQISQNMRKIALQQGLGRT